MIGMTENRERKGERKKISAAGRFRKGKENGRQGKKKGKVERKVSLQEGNFERKNIETGEIRKYAAIRI